MYFCFSGTHFSTCRDYIFFIRKTNKQTNKQTKQNKKNSTKKNEEEEEEEKKHKKISCRTHGKCINYSSNFIFF